MTEFTFYESLEELFDAEEKARKAADAKAKDWQKEARAGEVLVSQPYPDLIVFHEILDNEKIVKKYL